MYSLYFTISYNLYLIPGLSIVALHYPIYSYVYQYLQCTIYFSKKITTRPRH